MKKSLLLYIYLCLPVFVYAQTYRYYPMQSSFENESFFYHSVQLSPQTFGSFSQLLPGFQASNPLNELAQNPAWLSDLNGHDLYVYANVQSRNMYKKALPPYYYFNSVANYSSSAVNPNFLPVYDPYTNATGHRLDQKPFLTAAIIGYPFANKHIMAGITYQAIISKEDYYAYPSYSYPQDLFSNSNAASNAINPYSSFLKSTLKQTGHFLSLYGGYKLSSRAMVGLKVGAALFRRNGGYGHPTNYSPSIYQTIGPLPPFMKSDLLTEQRTQNYRHLAFDLGGRYIVNSRLTGMVHLGYLRGSGDENLNSVAPYSNEYVAGGPSDYHYISQRVTTTLEKWDNSGHAFNGGLSLQYTLPNYGRFQFFYEGYANHTGLTPSARVESFSYTSDQNSGTNIKESSTTTQSTELHSGDGSENNWTHQFGLFYDWSPTKVLTLNLGIQYDHFKNDTHTLEGSDITGITLVQTIDTTGQTTNTSQPDNSHFQVNWSNNLRGHSFQIPFIAKLRLFDRFEVWGGFNEQIEKLSVSDYRQPDPYPPYNPNIEYVAAFPVYTDNIDTHIKRYRFTLLTGVNLDVTNRLTLHLSALPLDHRYSYYTTRQTSGLIWQAGLSFYP